EGCAIAYIADLHTEPRSVLRAQPLHVPLDARPRQVVEDDHLCAVAQQAVRQVAADEPSTTSDKDRTLFHAVNRGEPQLAARRALRHTVNPRVASSWLASSTLSYATWPLSHDASSMSPSSSCTSRS